MIDGVPSPAYVPPEHAELRRRVALAYRQAKIDGAGEQACFERAFAVYAAAEPERARDRIPASHEVNLMIASAINADPDWFWAPLRARSWLYVDGLAPAH